jgi:hypothetical protein
MANGIDGLVISNETNKNSRRSRTRSSQSSKMSSPQRSMQEMRKLRHMRSQIKKETQVCIRGRIMRKMKLKVSEEPLACGNCGHEEFNRLAGGFHYQTFECRWCGWTFRVNCLSCFKYGFTCKGGSITKPCGDFQPMGNNPACNNCMQKIACSGIVHQPECEKRARSDKK